MAEKSILQSEYLRQKYTLANPRPWERLTEIKGERFANYRQMIGQAERGELLTDFPVEVFLKLTLNCNHACPKCLHGKHIFPAGKQYNMSFDTMKKVIDQGKESGLQSIVFTGGEPTMNPEITKFIEYAGTADFPDFSMVSNGSLLTDELINTLLDNGLTRLNVSVDATTAETYKITHGTTDFEHCKGNIERLLELRDKRNSPLPLLSVSFVLSEESAHELDDFVAYWESKADGGIKIYPFKDVFSVVDDQFDQTYGSGKKRVEQVADAERPHHMDQSLPIMEKYHVQCTGPWYRCHVGINGEIQGCTTQGFCDHPHMVLGNIHEDRFVDVWKGEAWTELRRLVLAGEYDRHPVCSICQQSVQKHA